MKFVKSKKLLHCSLNKVHSIFWKMKYEMEAVSCWASFKNNSDVDETGKLDVPSPAR